MKPDNQCPRSEELAQFASGQVSDERWEFLAAHLEVCAACQDSLSDIAHAEDRLLVALATVPPANSLHAEPECAEAVHIVKEIAASRTELDDGLPGSAFLPLPAQLGVYSLSEELGRGGMGAVFKARHTKLDKMVAVKLLPPERTRDTDAVMRFEREMKAIGSLNHENVAQAFDAQEIDGMHLLAFEYIDGPNLSEIVRAVGPLPIPAACEIIRQAAVGLQYTHENGLVHRDIKPSNIMLRPDGRVVIVDFGLALLAQDSQEGEEMTAADRLMGTADYIAPEQANDSHQATIQADIYSLGCTFYKLLTGHAPFSGPNYKTNLQKICAHAKEPVPAATTLREDIPPGVLSVLERMLEKDTAKRTKTPGEVAESLAEFAATADLQLLTARRQQSARQGVLPGNSLASTKSRMKPPADETDATRIKVQTQSRWSSFVATPTAIVVAVIGLIVLCGILIIIKNRQGDEIARVEVDAELQEVGGIVVKPHHAATKENEQLAPKPSTSINIPRSPVTIKPGEPISATAITTNPPLLNGAISWTLETKGHRGTINVLELSPDRKKVASGADDGSIRIWDAESGKLLHVLLGHNTEICSLSWSPDGKFLLSASYGRSIIPWDPAWAKQPKAEVWTWDVDSATLVNRIANLSTVVWCASWSPDGTMIAVSGEMPSINVYDAVTGKLSKQIPINDYHCRAFDWSPNSKQLAVGGWHGHVLRLLDVETAKVVVELGDVDRPTTTAVEWSDDGRFIALSSGHAPEGMEIWDVIGETRVFTENMHFQDIVWSPGEASFIAVQHNGHFIILPPGNLAENRPYGFLATDQKLRALCPSGSKDKVFVGGDDGVLLTIDRKRQATSSRLQQKLVGIGNNIKWSPNGSLIASADGDVVLRVWEPHSGALSKTDRSHHRYTIGANQNAIFGVSWFDDSLHLASASQGLSISIFNLQDNNSHRISFDKADRVGWTHNMHHIVVGRYGALRLLDINRGETVSERKISVMTAFALCPTSDIMAIGDDYGGIRLWDGYDDLKVIETGFDKIRLLSWSSDGKVLATSDGDVIQLWDADERVLLDTLRGHKAEIVSLRWRPDDSQTLLSIGRDRKLTYWNAATGKIIKTVGAPADTGEISPDGRFVASRVANTLRIWNAETGQVYHSMIAAENNQWLTASADGHYRTSPRYRGEMVYVVLTKDGQQVLTPKEFENAYGWKNDPTKVRPIE